MSAASPAASARSIAPRHGRNASSPTPPASAALRMPSAPSPSPAPSAPPSYSISADAQGETGYEPQRRKVRRDRKEGGGEELLFLSPFVSFAFSASLRFSPVCQ